MSLYARPQLVLLLGLVIALGVGVAVGHLRARHPDVIERIEQFDRDPPPPDLDEPDAPVTARAAAVGGRRSAPPLPSDEPRPAPKRRTPEAGPLDLNRASAEELRTLPGVGPVLAARIVEARDTDGPFGSVDDLRRVRGVGASKLERLRPFLTIRD